MKYTYPDYYKKFSCTADRCEATCCAGWQIVVDEKSLKKYEKVNGEFAERIKNGVDFKEGVFFQRENKRCAFLNESNLCDMFTALGEEALCETCANYPRHIEEFENVREYTLSISCPVVAEMILSKKEPVHFDSEEREPSDEMFDDFDPMVYEVLAEAREVMLEVLQDRSLSVEFRAAVIWKFIVEFQNKMDEGTLYLDEDLYGACLSEERREALRKRLETLQADRKAFFARAREQFEKLCELETLAQEWEENLTETEKVLYGAGADSYVAIKQEFMEWRKENIPDWDIMAEQLIVYFLSTYFCGAVYDEYVASKVKMSVLSVFYIEEMLTAQWVEQERKLQRKDIIRMVYRFSRELEHSDENLCAMDRLMEEL